MRLRHVTTSSNPSLDNRIDDLTPARRWGDIAPFGLLDARDTSPKVHLTRLPDFSPLRELVAKVKDTENGNTEIVREEGRGVELAGEETVETGGEDEENDPEDSPVRKPWLKLVVI